MSPVFSVITVPKTARLLRKLHQRHPDLKNILEQAVTILSHDPNNRSRKHQIKKLENVLA